MVYINTFVLVVYRLVLGFIVVLLMFVLVTLFYGLFGVVWGLGVGWERCWERLRKLFSIKVEKYK